VLATGLRFSLICLLGSKFQSGISISLARRSLVLRRRPMSPSRTGIKHRLEADATRKRKPLLNLSGGAAAGPVARRIERQDRDCH
jgi:hypothetical protein